MPNSLYDMSAECEPQFLDGPSGPLFSMYFPPAGRSRNHLIIHLPAFSEEMNKSRRMVALQARSLASLGYHVLVFDLFGTGDSAGEFADATWEAWLQDLAFVWDWAEQKDHATISLWGLRMGCLLGLDFLARHRKKVPYLLFWQPPANGQTLLTSFLRLRVASAMIGEGPRESTKMLMDTLAQGGHIEVAGYSLGPDLALPISRIRLENLPPAAFDALFWLELSNLPKVDLLPASLRALDQLKAKNAVVLSRALKGTAFWSTQEITEARVIIEETENLLSQQS